MFFNDVMIKTEKGIVHLTTVLLLAILLILTTWITGQQTQISSKASNLPRDYYGIIRKNDFLDCISRLHLANLEEDAIVHCLIVSRTSAANDQSLGNLVNQNVKIYGEVFKIDGKQHLLIQSIEKSAASFAPLPKNKLLDTLGDFINQIFR